ncbi:hypothetical protein [Mycolicibacterium mageritense]|uniref:hypothetical protein n=1 Tax=Mycolicibacterium mageritense TaxID=53462 RepID=UPI0011D3B001|nr:hypothetical protein [Mycolicibacterium mageritense]TXI62475.1 MAG: hypothetical protein E6Q55_12695 [Mycolicibacterium mageritense]
MSQFDDAVARASADRPERQAQAASERNRQLQHAEDAARLEPELRRLVAEFAKYVAARTPPRAYKIPGAGVFSRKSPVGVPISADVRRPSARQVLFGFTLVTEDGRVWVASNAIDSRFPTGFIDLSAAALAKGLSWPLGGGGHLVVRDGQLQHQHRDGDRSSYTHYYTPVHEDLAKLAVELGDNPVALRYPEFFK